ncbi:MAG: sigma-54-dependent Fis family transcriptional regulator, partial [Candidatus Electrothrix sp. AR3]|nr:sigma-54-dependent Fis family transcriptional regulator [Candidatus Electrothrix sp. AR3]
MAKIKVLAVDDEDVALKNLCHILQKEGYQVIAAKTGQQALTYLERQEFALVLTDLKMPGVDGMQILQRIRTCYPKTEVIMITGYSTVDSAIEALKAGAYHYIAKPFRLDEVRQIVCQAIEKFQLKNEVEQLKKQVHHQKLKPSIITHNRDMQSLLDMAR